MFSSIFAQELSSFIVLRQATCTDSTVSTNISVLIDFDRYVSGIHLLDKTLSEETIAGWIKTYKGKRNSLVFRIGVLQQFLYYLNRKGITAYVPETPRERSEYIPYIFSEDEIRTIFMLADSLNLNGNHRCATIQLEFPMILRLLYGCGLRVGETLALRLNNVDLDGGILILKYTKGQKQRIVPMEQSLTTMLRRYCSAMQLIGNPDAYLFPGATSHEALTISAVQARFHRLLCDAGIVQKDRAFHARGPCLHCFRHTFAVKSFVAAEMSGRALVNSVPFISVYLGHVNLNETDKYLKYCTELYPEAIERFSEFTDGLFREVIYDEN